MAPAPDDPTPDRAPTRSSVRAGVGLVALGLVGAVLAWTFVDSVGSGTAPAPSPTRASSPSPGPSSPSPAVPSPTVTTPSPATTPDWDAVVADVDDGLVNVLVETCDGDRYAVTGFHLSRRLVVTSARGVRRAAEVRVGLGGEQHAVRVVGVRPGHGLALLEAPTTPADHRFRLATGSPAIDAEVAWLGADPDRGLVEAVETRVTAGPQAEDGAGVRGAVATVARPPDDSFLGGPLVTGDGEVVGVARGGPRARGDAVAADVVRADVDAWTREGRPRWPRCGRSTPTPTPTPTSTEDPFDTPSEVPAGEEPRGDRDGGEPGAGTDEKGDEEKGGKAGGEETREEGRQGAREREQGPQGDTPSPTASSGPATPTWIVVLESLAVGRFDAEDAARRARPMARRLGVDVRVLRSGDYGSLNPGYWVSWYGPFDAKPAATRACARATDAGVVCYPRRLAD